MKKFICGLAVMVIILSSMIVPASAYQIGDKVGDVVYTDIAAYINHYPIPSYAYDGGMVVVAEDLVNYGFDVSYDNNTRSLSIVPNRDKTLLPGMGKVYKNGNRLGQYYSDALYSDINVYFNGSWIPSCAINGYMMVKLEDLANEVVGTSFTWDNSTRSAKLWLDWAGITEYKALEEGDNTIDPPEAEELEYRIYNEMQRIKREYGIDVLVSEINDQYVILEGDGQTFLLSKSDEPITLGLGAPPQYGGMHYFISVEDAIKLIKQRYGVDVIHTLTGNTMFWFEGEGYTFSVQRWYETNDINSVDINIILN